MRSSPQLQDQCIRDVVALQEEVGLQVVTDGEFRRGSYWGRFVERTQGFEIKPASFKFRDDQRPRGRFHRALCQGQDRPRAAAGARRVHVPARRDQADGKITLPAPSTMHFYRCNDFADRAVYHGRRNVLRRPGESLSSRRLPSWPRPAAAISSSTRWRSRCCAIRRSASRSRASAAIPTRLVDLYIDSINQAVAECPADVVIGVHMCRGNFKGHYLGAGGYESVAERFFANTKVNHFLLEYDTPRAGDFAPLRFVPKNKGVVLGLVSSKTPVLESLDQLKRRTEEATRYIDLDRLAISPQCGFASTVAGNPLTEEDERAKLALVVKLANTIWR